MPRYQRNVYKRKGNKSFWSTVVLAFLLYIMVSFGLEVHKLYVMHREVDSLSNEVYRLKLNNEKLMQDIKRVKNSSYFEAKAREMGFVKPGEQVIVIEKKGQKANASSN